MYLHYISATFFKNSVSRYVNTVYVIGKKVYMTIPRKAAPP
ncbi:hypothetical protein HMPREF9445_01046 [Bacteroides clarus YIT 12056]|uniref:Uncharacterized protein n=1 Tax=Bacteroides clarus YIT 12056 TaxID=762984 RepID=A0ABP2KW39_9BACE|nr:hypothetical protein HMPREF9445_01046 [Bacteroides clarus YIT 12056]